MSYEFVFQVLDELPTLSLRGTKTLEAALEITTKMRAIIREMQLQRMLVIDEMVDELTVWDAVDIEAFFVAQGCSRTIRVAIVDAQAGQECNSNAFNELFLRNRGWPRIQVFVDRSDAVAWLKGDPEPCLCEPPLATLASWSRVRRSGSSTSPID